jgi:hypothetical protein
VTKDKQPERKELACAEVLIANRLSIRDAAQATVKQYEQAMRAGAEFPAIEVALINGKHYLIDGQHRLRAASGVGKATIGALVHKLTWAQASSRAAVANTTHGRPLREKEKAKALAAFLRDPESDKMSLQEVVDALGGIVSRSSVWNHRNKANAGTLRGSEARTLEERQEAAQGAVQDKLREEGTGRLEELEKLYERMSGPEDRFRFLEELKASLQRMEAQGNAAPGPLDI